LDQDLRQESGSLFNRVIEKRQIPTLLVTHDPLDVEFLATKMTTIKNGRLVDGPDATV
jgi:ABC-type thiamine transport system ATPase subunit